MSHTSHVPIHAALVAACASLMGGCAIAPVAEVPSGARMARLEGPGVAAHDASAGRRPRRAATEQPRVRDHAPRQEPLPKAPQLDAPRLDDHDAPRAESAPRQVPLLAGQALRCPAEMALVLDRVCVDRWESTLVELLPDGAERAWSPFQPPDGRATRVRAVSQPNVVPQGYISGEQAEAACNASGKRLCTSDEWEAACRGPQSRRYPYGNRRQRRVCNDDGRDTHPVFEVTKRMRLDEDRMWYEGMDHPLINQLRDTLEKSGDHAACTNDYGVFDMVGNLHEWIDDPEGTFRGGYYMDTRKNGEGCAYSTTAHSKEYHDYSTGFRCCLDADPIE